jgi:hypothetical protein
MTTSQETLKFREMEKSICTLPSVVKGATMNIDTKGLNDLEIQRAIDRYISFQQQASWQAQFYAKRKADLAQKRVEQGKRLRLVNAIKRGKVSVRTEESWRGREVEVPRKPNAEGWYILELHPQAWRSVGSNLDDQTNEYNLGLARLAQKLQDNPEIEFVIETKVEAVPSWYEDQTPRVNTYYKARLVVDTIEKEDGLA